MVVGFSLHFWQTDITDFPCIFMFFLNPQPNPPHPGERQRGSCLWFAWLAGWDPTSTLCRCLVQEKRRRRVGEGSQGATKWWISSNTNGCSTLHLMGYKVDYLDPCVGKFILIRFGEPFSYFLNRK